MVAAPLFLQNFTATVLATALPSMAIALKVDVLHLNLAITLYLLSVAVGLPLAAWLSDRVGVRRLFCIALVLFSLGSVFAAASDSLSSLSAARIVQGLGGAMMLPVGRLILLRTIPPEEIVKATIWYTVPPIIGATLGPLAGAVIVTHLSWPWLFLINIPIALAACIGAMRLLDRDIPSKAVPFDFISYALLAATLFGFLAGLAGSGKGLLSVKSCLSLLAIGIVAAYAYLWHSRRSEHPVMDFSLLRFETLKASIVGGLGVRVGQGAAPFMLPLMLQLGFGLSAVAAGSLIFIWSLGSLLTRPILQPLLEKKGFRWMLIATTLISSFAYFGLGMASLTSEQGLGFFIVLAVLLLFVGAARGLLLVGMNTLAYSEVPQNKMNYATAMSTMSQQVSNSFGVALAVLLLNAAMDWRSSTQLTSIDFWPGFVALSLINALALFYFVPLPVNAGAELLAKNKDPATKDETD